MLGRADVEALPGGALGVVRRPQDAWLGIEIAEDLALVPNVVAGCEDINAGFEKLVGQRRCDPETSGGILAVGDDEVDSFFLGEVGGALLDDATTWLADDVADKEDFHDWVGRE